jgi:hypothetical protein
MGAGKSKEDISDTTAPSIGPNTVIEREPPEQRLARGDQSPTDAMGLDKRRSVVGGSYSPSPRRQAAMWGLVVAVVIALAVGLKLLADELDQPPAKVENTAPWAQGDAPQKKPKPLE